MKKISKIAGITLAGLMALFLILWLAIRIPYVQNRLVAVATGILSKSLKTEVSVRHVDITPFNRYLIEGVLVKDQQKDTLLYAGELGIRITDWFFMKDAFTVHHIGLSDVYLHTSRTDSTWNYGFIAKALGGGGSGTSAKSNPIQLDLESVKLKRIKVHIQDRWRGEDQLLLLEQLDLSTKSFNLNRRQIAFDQISIQKPQFSISRYEGFRPDSLKPKTIPRIAGKLYWNPQEWDITAGTISITAGQFSSDLETERAVYPHFDGAHLQFKEIGGEIRKVRFFKDTLTADLQLKTKERSGFEVKSLKAVLHMNPTVMAFNQLTIQTPYSTLGNQFAMHYNYLTDDMPEFITAVRMEGQLRN
ncbi:MAG: hypothetical protein RLY85_2224, partial [Bacteroidota bacterium]